VPRNPGILCALGLLLTDLCQDFSLTRRARLEASGVTTARAALAQLRSEAEAWFGLEGVAPDRRALSATIDMRYAGQNHELNVAVPDVEEDGVFLDQLTENFIEVHHRRYGYAAPEEPVELITFRLKASGLVEKPEFPSAENAGPDPTPAMIDHRRVYAPEIRGFTETPVYDRERLLPGNRVEGPAIIAQFDSTTLVLDGQIAVVDRFFNLIVDEGEA
jgi:N-methylhydantoinase A